MTSVFKEYKTEIMRAARNDRLRLALSRAIKSFRANVKNALQKFPHTTDLADEVLAVKQKAIPDMEKLAKTAIAAIEENKGKGYIARTPEEALDIIAGLVGKDKLIVKGKTMTGFANSEEDFADQTVGQKLMPFRIEDEARRLGANFVVAPAFQPHAVRDGCLITGQQQFSGGAVAQLVLEPLG